jgi:hypothetical protein
VAAVKAVIFYFYPRVGVPFGVSRVGMSLWKSNRKPLSWLSPLPPTMVIAPEFPHKVSRLANSKRSLSDSVLLP